MTIDYTKEGVGFYVIHAPVGYEFHEERIVQLFNNNSIPFEFITDGSPANFDKVPLSKYCEVEMLSKMSKGVVSCTLNHILAYEQIVRNRNSYAVVFENDPFFLGNFNKKLSKILNEAATLEPGFIISLENTTLRFPSYWDIKPKKHIYRATTGRMAGAYIIDFKAAHDILTDLQSTKCHTVIDWWHNSLIERGVVKMYWAHPALTEQGSHNGHLSSTISTKHKSAKRRMQWLLHRGYKMYVRRLFKEKRIII